MTKRKKITAASKSSWLWDCLPLNGLVSELVNVYLSLYGIDVTFV